MATEPNPGSHRFLPLLLVLFIGSGCSALIYEIVWFQLLQFVIGSSAVSLGVLLGTFMGGMCLGSLALARVISPRLHPLRIYALLELGIAVFGILVLFGMPSVDRLYTASVGHGVPGIMLRAVVCALCLLAPTLLMGATLPAISRWVETTPQGVSWLGFFYGGNITGAVFGCLLAGFYLLRVYDMATATYVAVAINLAVTLTGLGLAVLTPTSARVETPAHATRAPGSWPIYVAIALSGLSALGAEVIWTRLLSLMLGATVYTFSIILAVFLIGLGLGSSAGSFLSRGTARPRIALCLCQLFLTLAIAWAAYMLANSLPYWPIDATLSKNPWLTFQLDLVRSMWAILPAAFLWGASFPLALAGVAVPGQDPGRLVGGVYAANTAGAIIGAIGFSIFLIRWAGTQQCQRLLIGFAAAAALLMFAPFVRSARSAALPILAAGLAALLIWNIPAIPWGVVAYGRRLPTRSGHSDLLYMGEGMNASIAVTHFEDGNRFFHISGKIEASSQPLDMRLQRMLGHLPTLLHPNPRSILIVGCGAGVTSGSFVPHPEVTRIVICELEPLVPPTVARYFARENHNVVSDRRTEVVHDDARHYVLTARDKFDIITSDPIHPWVKGSATLYSKEYFEMCKRHLNPGGLVTQWVPLYESDMDTVKSEIATFFQVFPYGTIWSNNGDGEGYDLVLLGNADPLEINVDELEQRLARADHVLVAQSLREVGFRSAVELLSTYAGQGSDLQGWLSGAQINGDRNLRLQYLAGMGLNFHETDFIYGEILRYRKFPRNLFVVSDQTRKALRKELGFSE